jgi:hypothetical protein
MELYELPGEGEPESGAFRFLVRGPHLVKLLEHGLLIGRRDADARIRYRHRRRPVMQTGADVDPSPFERELQGVGEEVQEHLLHFPFVASDHPEALVDRAARA